MSAFDIGGRIVIDGDFEDTFKTLERRASEAERALGEIELRPTSDSGAIEQAIESQLAEVEKLQDALLALRADVDTAEADQRVKALQETVAALRASLTEKAQPVDVDIEAASQQLAILQKTIDGIKESLTVDQPVGVNTEEANQRIAVLQETVDELRATLAEASKPVEVDAQDASNQVAALQEAVDAVKTSLAERQTAGVNADEAIQQFAALQETIDALRTSLADNQLVGVDTEDANRQLTALQATVDAIGASLAGGYRPVEVETTEAAAQLTTLQGAVDALRSSLAEGQSVGVDTEDAVRRLAALQEAVDTIEASLVGKEVVGVDTIEATRQIVALQEAIDGVRATLGGARQPVEMDTSEAGQQLAALREAVDALNAALAGETQAVDVDTSEASQHLAALQVAIDSIRSSLDGGYQAVELDTGDASRQLTALQEVVDALSTSLPIEGESVEVDTGEASRQLSALQEAVATLRETLAGGYQPVEVDADEASRQLTALQGTVDLLRASLTEGYRPVEVDTSEAGQRFAALQEAIDTLRASLLVGDQSVAVDTDDASRQLVALQETVDAIAASLAGGYQAVEVDTREASQQFAVLQEAIDTFRASLVDGQSVAVDAEEASRQLAGLQGAIDAIAASLAGSQAVGVDASEANQQMVALQEAINGIKASLDGGYQAVQVDTSDAAAQLTVLQEAVDAIAASLAGSQAVDVETSEAGQNLVALQEAVAALRSSLDQGYQPVEVDTRDAARQLTALQESVDALVASLAVEGQSVEIDTGDTRQQIVSLQEVVEALRGALVEGYQPVKVDTSDAAQRLALLQEAVDVLGASLADSGDQFIGVNSAEASRQLSALQEAVNTLRSSLAEGSRPVGVDSIEANQQLLALQQTVDSLKSSLAGGRTVDVETGEASRQLLALRDAVAGVEAALSGSQPVKADTIEASQQIAALQEAVDAIQASLVSEQPVGINAEDASRQIAALQEAIDGVRDSLSGERQPVEVDTVAAGEQIAALQEAVDALGTSLAGETQVVDVEAAGATEQIAELQEAVDAVRLSLSKGYPAVEVETDDAGRQLAALQEAVDALGASLEGDERTVDVDTEKASQRIAELQEGVDALKETLASGRKLSPVEADFLASAQDAVKNLREGMREAEEAIGDLGAASEQTEEAVKQAVDAQLAEVEKLSDALRDLRVEVDTDEADKQLAELQRAVEVLKEKLAGGEQLSPVEADFLADAQAKVEGLKASLGGAAGKGAEAAGALLKYGKVALGVVGAVVTVTGAVYSFIKAQGMLGEELLKIERSFEVLSSARGIDSGQLIAGLEEAARGAVTSSELMKQANQLILRGAEEVAEKLPQLYDAARASAQLTGRETAAAFQGVTQSVLALDEAGLRAQGVFVNLTAANEAWAEANGRLVGSLSKVEKQMIAADAAIAASVPMIRELGLESVTAEEALAQLPVALENLKEGFAKTVAEGELFKQFLEFIIDLGAGAQAGVGGKELRKDVEEMIAALEAAGFTDVAKQVAEDLALIRKEQQALEAAEGWGGFDEQAARAEAYEKKLQALKAQYEETVRAALEFSAAVDSPSGLAPLTADAKAAADATSEFAAALARAREGIVGVAVLGGQFAGAIAEMEEFVRAAEAGVAMPDMPDISANLDVEKMRAWGNEMAKTSLAAAEMNVTLQATLDQWEQSQAVIVAQGFAAALADAREQASGLAAMQQQFLSAVVAGEGALQAMPEMPDITTTMDVEKLREWGDAWAALDPKLASANEALQGVASALQANQTQIMASAAAIPDLDAKVRFLVTAFGGADAEIDDFVAALGAMSPELLAQIGPADSLAAAIARLRASALDPISIDVALNVQTGIENTIEGLARRVGRLYDADAAEKFYATAIAANKRYWTTIDEDTNLGLRVAGDDITTFLTDMVNKADPAFNRVAQSAKQAFEAIGMSAGELRSKIESALMEGSTVTAQDMADTMAGAYEDAPLEAARRLDAIAARGFAELQAHPDWAGLLKIPPEVLSGSEEALKAWAARTSGAVRNLERADLIDWDAFAANFQAGLDRESAREYTLDVAVSELDARGLLSGSAEERREKVMEALGMGEPKLTFEALFKAEEDAGKSISSQVGQVPIEAILKILDDFSPDTLVDDWLAAYDSPGLVIPVKPETEAEIDGEEATVTPVDASRLVDVEAAATDLQAAGARAIELVETGAETYLLTTNIAGSVATTWTTSFAASSDTFAAIGTSLGTTVAGAFKTAMEESVGTVRRRIAELVAPEVAAILNQGGGGALP